ncbi:MAG: hypothetical protein ACP5HX_09500 [Thermoproteota archaeon]
MSTSEKFYKGLTLRVLLVLLYATLFVAPMDLFLSLSLGASYLTGGIFGMLVSPSIFILLITFTEIARFYGKPFTTQEVFIMYNLLGPSMSVVFFLGFLYQGYFRVSPVSNLLIDPRTGKPMCELLPYWYSPPASAFSRRTFLDPAWLPVVGVATTYLACYVMLEVGLGLLLSYSFVYEEKLPFPTAPIDASAIETLAERDPHRMVVFSVAAIISAIWSILTFGTPSVLGGAFGVRVGVTTFLDITPFLNRYIQGPVMAITFELFPYLFAWIWLEPTPVISILVGSYALYFFGNILALKLPFDFLRDFQHDYRPGMTVDLLMSRSYLWVWASFILGAALGLTIFSIIRSSKYLLRSLKSLIRVRGTESRYPSLYLLLLLWLGGGLGIITLTYALIPSFPVWVSLLFTIVVPFMNASLSARLRGEVGLSVSIPYMKESMILLSGYKGTDIFLSHVYYWGWGMGNNAASYVYVTKVAELTKTNPFDYFKGLFVIIPITWIVSFIVVSLFLKTAPIPSEVFTMSTKLWPEQIVEQSFSMINFDRIYKPPLIGLGFIVLVTLSILTIFIKIPLFDVASLLAGFTIPPYYANALLIGFVIGNYGFRKWLGDDWWKKYRLTFLAGAVAGFGIIAGIAGSIILISKVLWYTQAIY